MKEQKNLMKNYVKPQLLKILSDLFLLILLSWEMFKVWSNRFTEIRELFQNKDVKLRSYCYEGLNSSH